MADYMIKHYKGRYRLLAELCTDTNDFPRTQDGGIDPDVGIYIACAHDMKITYYGLGPGSKDALVTYIPSKGRGRNIYKALKERGIDIFDYDESDSEVMFKFFATDIEPVAEIMKARTSGANISPFSSKNLPKNKDVVIPEDEMAKYKAISCKVDKKDVLMFKKWNSAFLEGILQKKIRKDTKNRKFNWKDDAKKMRLGRQTKEYIFAKGFWNEYCEFLDNEINAHYS